MLAQCRSERANTYQTVMSFWLLSNGASRSLFGVLHHACLCVSYTTATRHLRKLTDERLEHVRGIVKKKPFLINWDNLCLRHDVAEQREDNKSRFLSGTTVSVIELFGIKLGELQANMLPPRTSRLPIMKFKRADLVPTLQQQQELDACLIYHVVDILFDFYPTLKDRFKEIFKAPVVHIIPNHKTVHHSLPYLPINESSLDGTLSILETIIRQVLQMHTTDVQKQGLIICSGDLLTWSLTDKVRTPTTMINLLYL